MLELFKKYREQISYLFFGGCTTLVNIVAYWVCTRQFGIDIYISTTIGWFVSVTFAYITNKIWVFESKTHGVKQFCREVFSFYLCRGATYILDLGIMRLFVEILSWNDMVVKIGSNILVILINYVLSKLLIFKTKNSDL